jgi:hypothetical protein
MDEQQTKTIDERFEDVTQAFLDQRDYTTFVYDKLTVRFEKIDGRLDKIDGRLDKIDGRLDKSDGRLGRIELVLSEVLNEIKALSSRNG